MRKSRLLHLVFTVFVLLSFVNGGRAGMTSKFIRSEWPSIDIPLDNEAFAVPKGHNAPQQVRELLSFFSLFIRIVLVL